MIIINIFDYVKGSKKFEPKSFSETKNDIEELHEYNIDIEDLEISTLFKEGSMYVNNEDFVQFRLIASEIKDKQEITNKLKSLADNIDLLNSISPKKHQDFAIRIVKNNFNSMHSIITDLNSLKNSVDKFENLHTTLMNSGLSLDVKILLEQDFRNKHVKLNELYLKQKNIFLNLSSIFLKLAKSSVFKR